MTAIAHTVRTPPTRRSADARSRRIPRRSALLGRHQPARPRGGRRVLRRAVRLGDRERHAGGLAAASTSWRGSAAATWPPSARSRRAAGPPSWNTYIWVDSADDTAAKVREAGGSVLSEPFDVFDSGRMAVFADPEGAVFCVWQAAQHTRLAGRQRARLASTSTSSTPATSTARSAFYGAVFGWEAARHGRPAALDAARLRRPPRGAQPGDARAHGRDGRARRLRSTSSRARSRSRRPAGTPPLGRDLRRRRRRRDRRAAPRSSAARCSWRRSTRRGCG